MKRSLLTCLCLGVLIAGSWGCSSDDNSAENGSEAGVAADTEQDLAPAKVGDAPKQASTSKKSSTRSASLPKLNINTATSEKLGTIPDVGKRMIHEFEEYRPYVSIRQFRQEMGKYVDAEKIAAYEEYIFVPVDPNESDAETLGQLPGVTAALAKTLAEKRPFSTRAAFLMELSKHVSDPEARAAAAYLKRR